MSPKQITKTVYTARELRDTDGMARAFQRAYERYCDYVSQDTFTMDEILDSLKALFEAAGVRMANWGIGAYSHSYIRAEFPSQGYGEKSAADLTGARAFAWIENNLLAQYRAPWGLPHLVPGAPLPNGFTRSWEPPNVEHPNGCLHPDDSRPVTRWTRPGARKECPFTGMCYDEDFIDALVKALRAGDTLREAFKGLANVAQRMIEAEDEWRKEESSFLEMADANGWEYDEDGRAAGPDTI